MWMMANWNLRPYESAARAQDSSHERQHWQQKPSSPEPSLLGLSQPLYVRTSVLVGYNVWRGQTDEKVRRTAGCTKDEEDLNLEASSKGMGAMFRAGHYNVSAPLCAEPGTPWSPHHESSVDDDHYGLQGVVAVARPPRQKGCLTVCSLARPILFGADRREKASLQLGPPPQPPCNPANQLPSPAASYLWKESAFLWQRRRTCLPRQIPWDRYLCSTIFRYLFLFPSCWRRPP